MSLILFSSSCWTLTNITPPPGTIPSSLAALVAFKASSILNFLSFNSTSVAAPTSITATPPDNFAIRSWSFSLSYSESDISICFLISLTLSATFALVSSPTTIVVSSLVTVTLFALPIISVVMFSNLIPSSSVNIWPPVKIAISSSIAFLLSPKPGALTATALNTFLIVLTTNVANASPSTSSAINNNERPSLATCSNTGTKSEIKLIFLLTHRT